MAASPDIWFATGATHDEYGLIATFAAVTDKGRDWLNQNMAWDIDTTTTATCAMIEADQADLALSCMEADGIVVGMAQ